MKLALHMNETHPSPHALARLHLGEGEGTGGPEPRTHVDGCPDCSATLDGLERERSEFFASRNRAGFLAAVRDRAEQVEPMPSWWRGFLAPAPILAAAAAACLIVAVLVAWPGSPDRTRPGDRDIIIKSVEMEMGYLVEENGRPVLAHAGRILHPGDRIQFRLSAPRGGFVHIVGVDEARLVSVYYPRPGEVPEAYPGGSGRPVPGSVILDATLGRERVFALICDRPLEREQLVERVHGLADDPRIWIDRTELPVDCQQTSLVLVKE